MGNGSITSEVKNFGSLVLSRALKSNSLVSTKGGHCTSKDGFFRQEAMCSKPKCSLAHRCELVGTALTCQLSFGALAAKHEAVILFSAWPHEMSILEG